MATPRNPADIQGGLTAYEIVATDGAATMRLAFAVRRTRERLHANMLASAAEIVTRFDLGEGATIEGYAAATGWKVAGNGKAVHVRFSGRTERECYWTECEAAKAA